MDLLLLLKLVHVVAACLWVGGSATLALLVLLTDRKGDDAAPLGTLSLMGLAGRHVFSRVSHVTLGPGVILAWLGGWGLAPWVVLSVVVAGANMAYLKRVLAPGAGRIMAARGQGDLAGAAALARRQLRRIGTNLSTKATIVVLMVLKPGLMDPLMLLPAALLCLGAALHFHVPSRTPAAQPA